jgi:branched-chain amino acid transport system substrate-binding protein
MNRTKFSLLLAAPLLLAASCQNKSNQVKIALAIPLTGDIASLGQGIKRATQLAIEQSNSAKKLPYDVQLISFDDRSDPKEAVSVANRIVADSGVVAVVGHFNSGCSIPASSIYAQAGIAMLTPASSNPVLTDQQLSSQWTWPRCIFRVNTTDQVQGPYGADFAVKSLKFNKAAIIHDKTSYGQGVAEEFRKAFEKDGGTVLAFEGVQVGDRDFRSVLTRVKALGPQLIYFGGQFSEGGLLVRQARDVGFAGGFMASEANYDPAFIKVAGPGAENAYVTFLGSPPELLASAQSFIDSYKKRYPNDEVKAYDHYAYEVTSLVLEALGHVGPDRAKIIDYLHHVDYHGVLGETQFDEKGDTLNKTITIFQVKNGIFVPIKKS